MTDYCEAGVPDEKGRGGCRAYDSVTRLPAALEGRPRLCEADLEPAERDIRALVLDYRDLEQHLPPSLGVWGDGQPKGKSQPLPLSEHVLDLQREIWWLTTAWEDVLRDADRLSMTGDWSKRRRDGLAVQQAMAIVGPRVRRLAELGPCEMWGYPGYEGVVEIPGWRGVLDLARLHARARAALGLTREEPTIMAGVPCRHCDAAALHRRPGDDAVHCGRCGLYYSPRDYTDWVALVAAAAKRAA